ncbi:hypothetical protein [Nocardia sp. NPDC004604]|uniref:hypothetical protein n=1 Tax=Nocardia sp. NPDC004604 TaxID=3157013 RepID=UPI0033B7A9D7
MGEEAKAVMTNWDDQVDLGVAWHRGLMGRYRDTEWAQKAHQRLWQFPEFRRKWEAGDVAYARDHRGSTVAGARRGLFHSRGELAATTPLTHYEV